MAFPTTKAAAAYGPAFYGGSAAGTLGYVECSNTLTIAAADLRRLCGLASTDTSLDTILNGVLTSEQPALEQALDPGQLLSATEGEAPGLLATLTLGVAEQLAGSALQIVARQPLALTKLTFGGLALTPPTPAEYAALGLALIAKGTARLGGYTRATLALGNAANNSILAEPVAGVELADEIAEGPAGAMYGGSWGEYGGVTGGGGYDGELT
jgi:hypothetical protein